MEISKITSNGRVTIPYNLRKAAHFNEGDNVCFDLEGEKVIITKSKPTTDSYLNAASSNLDEWLSDNDEKAWHDL